MKIAQFIIGSHGGAERFYVKLLTALREHGVEQHAIHNDHPRLVEAVAASGVPATIIPFKKGSDRAGRAAYRETLANVQPDVPSWGPTSMSGVWVASIRCATIGAATI